jgi:hypothetical protein
MIPTSLSRPCTGWKAKQTLREDRGKNDKSGRAQLVPTRRQGDVLHAVRIRQVAPGEGHIGLGMLALRSHLPVWVLWRPVADRHLEGRTTCFG